MGKTSLKAFADGLRKHKTFLLSCHISPEGDAIGSMLAMASLLTRLKKKVYVVCQDEFPERLSFLSSRHWRRTCELKKAPEFDALVLTDCPTLERIGDVQTLIGNDVTIFNIDHHISNDYYGKYNYVKPDAAATAEVVLEIFEHFKMRLTKEDAKNLYVGVATDTGSFKYSNTTYRTHQIAAKLIRTGIDIEKINDQIHGRFSLASMKLYSRIMGRIRSAGHGKLAWASMSREDLAKSGAAEEDIEGFIDFIRYLKGVKIAFFLYELGQGKGVRVSFRSIGAADVNKIATHFNGGGHKKASGCLLKTSLAKAEKMIVKYICDHQNF